MDSFQKQPRVLMEALPASDVSLPCPLPSPQGRTVPVTPTGSGVVCWAGPSWQVGQEAQEGPVLLLSTT